MTPQQEKERAWQFLTLLNNSNKETVAMFGYEKSKLLQLLPSLQPEDVVTNSDGDVTSYIFNREKVINGLKLKYQFHLKSLSK